MSFSDYETDDPWHYLTDYGMGHVSSALGALAYSGLDFLRTAGLVLAFLLTTYYIIRVGLASSPQAREGFKNKYGLTCILVSLLFASIQIFDLILSFAQSFHLPVSI